MCQSGCCRFGFQLAAASSSMTCVVLGCDVRKVQRSVAPDLASAVRSSNNIGGSSSLAHSDEQDEVVGWDEAKTRCPCGNTVDTGTMIQVISLSQFAVCSPPSLLLMYLLQSCDDKFISGWLCGFRMCECNLSLHARRVAFCLLASIMTESSCCFWKCNRNSGMQICTMFCPEFWARYFILI
jgi:hypothetical protein